MLERNIIIISTVVVLTSIFITFLIYMLVKSDQIVIPEKNVVKQNYIVIQSPDNQFAIGIENNDMPPLFI